MRDNQRTVTITAEYYEQLVRYEREAAERATAQQEKDFIAQGLRAAYTATPASRSPVADLLNKHSGPHSASWVSADVVRQLRAALTAQAERWRARVAEGCDGSYRSAMLRCADELEGK
jgi:hypothetical protein